MVGASLSLRANRGCEQTCVPARLAVIDAAAVDGQRRLVLIRRDNVEHLLMIGGRTDIVIEPNIVRATALARPLAFEAATQHPAVTKNEQLEPAPAVFTPPRPQQEPIPQHTEAEPPVPLAPRQPHPVDRLASDQPRGNCPACPIA
jgi:hypothetical protein